VLFTGAGFSAAARDRSGRPLPDGEQMRRELWALVFGDGEPDDSSLADLFDVALARCRAPLERYLADRLRIGGMLAPYYGPWFRAPWHKIYTLNVDDLAAAVAVQFELPALDVIHLNGMVDDGADRLTFSTLQYAARLCGKEHAYEVLANDLERSPFVFVGTTLDEVILWQHVELQRRRSGHAAPARRSYLVARRLSRARQMLLEGLGLIWIQASFEELADQLTGPA
jgi:hypothetical protein